MGDHAALVSRGQAQRIIIARALLQQPKILILDEFKDALDVDTEEAITDKVLDIMKRKTRRLYCFSYKKLMVAGYI